MNANTGRSPIGRIALILAVSAAIVVFALYQGHAIMGRSDPAAGWKTGHAILTPPDGSTFIRSYSVVFNGAKTRFAHYRSALTARELMEKYARRTETEAVGLAPHKSAPALTSHGTGCSAYSYVTADGTSLGVVAFDNRQTGGCEYFVGASPAAGAEAPSGGDCPGREPPGVPKPPRSTRMLCIENLGGLASVLLVYEAWGRPSQIADDIRHDLVDSRWTERAGSSRILTENYQGTALLSFVKGREQCIVAVDREASTGKIVIVVLWAERPWFPDGTAL